ncbi:MAG: 4-hydroxy-tetrahydrodipicolinate reductase [Methanobacteriota archaeon]
MKIKVAISGALGKMGSSIIRTLAAQEDMQVVCAVEAPGSTSKGKDIGEVLGIGKLGVAIATSDELDAALKKNKPDVLVDFTVASAAVETVKKAAENRVNLVVGTTGFTEKQMNEIKSAIEKNKISAVISPNMAAGVNVFFKAAQEVAKTLGRECDIEIIEAHHKFKKDAPSGTALKLGELIAQAAGKNIGRFHSIRAGDIVGEHTLIFAGDGERIELTHRAHSRQAFVSGAIKAIRFVHGKKEGVYSTWDVLGIKGGLSW